MCLRDADGVNNLVKYLLFFFNFIFWIIGCILIAVGAWAYIEKNKFYHSEIESIYDILFDVSIGVIIIGCIIFVIAFAGCLGALRENIFLLKFFSYVLGVLFLLEVIGAVLIFVFSGQGKEEVTKVFRAEGIVRYRDDPDFQSIFDWVQETFKCCGVGHKGYLDWSLNPYFNCSETNYGAEKCAVPYSCCIKPNNIDTDIINKMCGYGVQKLEPIKAADVVHIKGCVQAIVDTAEQNMYIIGGVAIALAVPQFLGVLFGMCLVSDISRKQNNKLIRRKKVHFNHQRRSSLTRVYPDYNAKPSITKTEHNPKPVMASSDHNANPVMKRPEQNPKPVVKKSFPVIKNFSWIPWVAIALRKSVRRRAAALKSSRRPVAPTVVSMHNSQSLNVRLFENPAVAQSAPSISIGAVSARDAEVPYDTGHGVPGRADDNNVPLRQDDDVPRIEAELLPRNTANSDGLLPLNIPRPHTDVDPHTTPPRSSKSPSGLYPRISPGLSMGYTGANSFGAGVGLYPQYHHHDNYNPGFDHYPAAGAADLYPQLHPDHHYPDVHHNPHPNPFFPNFHYGAAFPSLTHHPHHYQPQHQHHTEPEPSADYDYDEDNTAEELDSGFPTVRDGPRPSRCNGESTSTRGSNAVWSVGQARDHPHTERHPYQLYPSNLLEGMGHHHRYPPAPIHPPYHHMSVRSPPPAYYSARPARPMPRMMGRGAGPGAGPTVSIYASSMASHWRQPGYSDRRTVFI